MTNASKQVITGAGSGTPVNTGQAVPVDTQGAPSAMMQAVWSGTLTGGVITFEGSDVEPPAVADSVGDRAKWVSIGTAGFISGGGTNKVSMPAGDAYRYVRARISTVLVGAGTVDVFIATAGYQSGGWN